MYTINLTGHDTVQANSCVDASCKFPVIFTEFSKTIHSYDLIIEISSHSHVLKEFRHSVGKF